jgi:hypothetical protein
MDEHFRPILETSEELIFNELGRHRTEIRMIYIGLFLLNDALVSRQSTSRCFDLLVVAALLFDVAPFKIFGYCV